MAISKLNDLLDQNDSTQASSYLYENGTGIAIDYSPYLSRIAASLETIATKISSIESLAKTDGIKSTNPYEWIGLMSIYKHYVDNPDTAIGLDALKEYKAKIDSLPKSS
jgi:hypothetical protein